MTKIDIFSGFLGAGKTTLIKKLIKEAYAGQKLVLIENEFGEIGIDGGFLKDAGVQINEMNSGCICCSLVGDFSKALTQVLEQYSPDRILIEPSGVGKLSDVIKAVQNADTLGASLGAFVTVADVTKCKMYIKNFGEFYLDQIQNASAVILSRTDSVSQEKIDTAVSLLRQHNPDALIITTPWDELSGQQIVEAIENTDALEKQLHELKEQQHEHHHHNEHCEHHDHEHHHHDEHCEHHDHEHHHHDEHCDCHDHEHHHHHADEVFASWGVETSHKFTTAQIEEILGALSDESKYGIVLRAKGIVQNTDGSWIHYDYVPGCPDVRTGCADVTGRICVIGSKINENALKELFGV